MMAAVSSRELGRAVGGGGRGNTLLVESNALEREKIVGEERGRVFVWPSVVLQCSVNRGLRG